MKNIIEYFYRLEIDKISNSNEKYYVFSGNDEYIFEECKRNISVEILMETQKFKKFHSFVTNIRGSIFTSYENGVYVLLKVNINENRRIILDDIVEVAMMNLSDIKNNVNWDILWQKKIDSFELYTSDKMKKFDYRDYYDYFIGLGENAISYFKYAKTDNIRIGFTYNRINYDYTLYDLYDPLNVVISSPVKGISEYMKSSFFNDYEVDIFELEKIDLSSEDMILLISRMLFPTYFFDFFKIDREDNNKKMQRMINLSSSYERYLSFILKYIKKRHNSMPQIKWLTINQL